MEVPVVTAVRVLKPYVLDVTFDDGVCRRVDIAELLHGEVFEPLRDVQLFSQASVDPVWHTVVWPNGADLAPEWLYEPDPDKYRKMTNGDL
jgi:hypothetical protein